MTTFLHILTWIGIGLLALLGLFSVMCLGYAVHCALEQYCYIPYAKRYCRRRGLVPESWRCAMAFQGGVKTEFSIVELHCRGSDQQEHVIELLVWFLGVRAVLRVDPPMPNNALQRTEAGGRPSSVSNA